MAQVRMALQGTVKQKLQVGIPRLSVPRPTAVYSCAPHLSDTLQQVQRKEEPFAQKVCKINT